MAAGDVRYARSDRWNFSPQAVPRGEMTVTGLARYYTAEEMGDEHPEHPDGPFRQAPAEVPNSRLAGTLVEPGFWRSDDRPALERRVRVGWRCCPPQVTVLEEDTHDR